MIKVTIQVGKSKPHLYEVPKKAAEEILTLAHNASSDGLRSKAVLALQQPTNKKSPSE
jgi:hypothetical protein